MQRNTRQLTRPIFHRVTASPRHRVAEQRRGSVLVLVMTLLGVLFVIGVAFLATMNFEAEMIAAQAHQDDRATAVEGASDQIGMLLQDVFANPTGGEAPYAELPQVHRTFGPVEPVLLVDAGSDGTMGTFDDLASAVIYPWITDPLAGSGSGGVAPRDAVVDPSLPPGFPIVSWGQRCVDGPQKGQTCPPATCPGSICEAPILLDADGDGVNDSVGLLASDLGLSEQQVAALAAQVNPPSNPGGRVFAALRIVPHGGMISLNDAHPLMIQNVFNDLTGGSLVPHSPRDRMVFYSPLVEEAGLRRRGILPAYLVSPSRLMGDPFATGAAVDGMNADMSQYLLWPDPQGAGIQTVRTGEHRYEPFTPCDPLDQSADCAASGEAYWWSYRMEPFTSGANFNGWLGQFDRRHLVTTISHDDLLARPSTTPLFGTERADTLTKMREANSAIQDPDAVYCVFPFEYAVYPHDLPDRVDPTFEYSSCRCGNESGCKFDQRKGRLKLSLAWLQRMLDVGVFTLTDEPGKVDAKRLIHDVFAAMLSNLVDGEPAFCTTNNDCPAGVCLDNVTQCLTNADCPAAYAFCQRQTCNPAVGRCGCTSSVECPSGQYCLSHPNSLIGGRCTAAAPYWNDWECSGDSECGPDEFCNGALGPVVDTYGLCVDRFTGLPRSQARLSRTAASLTANLIDFADTDYIPTRIALRNFDATRGFCPDSGASAGVACRLNAECIGQCGAPELAYGREFDSDLSSDEFGLRYVYGLERQPFITEVGVHLGLNPTGTMIDAVDARAIELFNPYSQNLDLSPYYIIEVDPSAGPPGNVVGLSGSVPGNGFATLVSAPDPAAGDALLDPPAGDVVTLGANTLTFGENWVVYLVRRFQYPGDSQATDIVLDQFLVNVAAGHIPATVPAPAPVECAPPANCRFSVERSLSAVSPWTAPVPRTFENQMPAATFGTWNAFTDTTIHPVELQNFDLVDAPTFNSVITRVGPFDRRTEAFPTPGSLVLPLRVTNRDIGDFLPPLGTGGAYLNLAFTTELDPVDALGNYVADTFTMLSEDAMGSPYPPISMWRRQEIDNGRLPIFDVGVTQPGLGDFGAHHVPPQLESVYHQATFSPTNPDSWAKPGGLRANPWGQLVFDYFTTLPLSNPGPYVCPANEPGCPPVVFDDESAWRLEGAKPRVDQDGLRVHGRVNLNAAPWKALAGVPFIPMSRIAGPFQNAIATAIKPQDINGNDVTDPNFAGVLGDRRAQAIVAYREAREIAYRAPSGSWQSTGDYGNPPNTLNPGGFRGWQNPAPLARRGTGLMGVGELANVRHPTPHDGLGPNFYYSALGVDSANTANQLVDNLANDTNNVNENFISAAAPLIALNEWVSVRSHVFTVYGVFRGEKNPDLDDVNTTFQQYQEDIDSRAIRFQETIDRLPVFLGQPLPQRIGERTTGSYTDSRSN